MFPHADSPTASFPSHHRVPIKPENNGIEKKKGDQHFGVGCISVRPVFGWLFTWVHGLLRTPSAAGLCSKSCQSVGLDLCFKTPWILWCHWHLSLSPSLSCWAVRIFPMGSVRINNGPPNLSELSCFVIYREKKSVSEAAFEDICCLFFFCFFHNLKRMNYC